MKSLKKSRNRKKSKKQKKNKKSYSAAGAIIGITSGYVSILLLLLYFIKKDKDESKNVRERSKSVIYNDDYDNSKFSNLFSYIDINSKPLLPINIDESKNLRERSDSVIFNDDLKSSNLFSSIDINRKTLSPINNDDSENARERSDSDGTIFEDTTEYTVEELIEKFNKEPQKEQIKTIKDYLEKIETEDVKNLIKYIVMNNKNIEIPVKIQIIIKKKSYFCIIGDTNNIQIIINDSNIVDKQSNYTLKITCNIDTALNLILNIYNSKNIKLDFAYNYKKINPFANYIPDCFKLYKNGDEIDIWDCVVKKEC